MKDMQTVERICWERQARVQKTTWSQIYDSEEELLNDLVTIYDNPKPRCYLKPFGCEYIDGIRKYYLKNGCVTPKQLVQVKRLAASIAGYKYFKIGF